MATPNSSNGASQPSAEERFFASCRCYADYPVNILSSQHSRWTRESQQKILEDKSGKVFCDDVRDRAVQFIDVDAPESGPARDTHTQQRNSLNTEQVTDLEGLVRYLHQGRDPQWRCASIQSFSSRDPLEVTPDMFKYLCAYLQIPPVFLNCAFAFRGSLSKFDYGFCAFEADDTLLLPDSLCLKLPRQGRSGREIRFSMLLRSVEPSASIKNQPWGIRQLGIYHSFDVANGRATWVMLKGNRLMKERMLGLAKDNPAISSHDLGNPNEGFAATLVVLMMVLEWVDDNWRWYIDSLEKEIRGVTTKARTAPVDDSALLETMKSLIENPGADHTRSKSFTQRMANGANYFQNICRQQTMENEAVLETGLSRRGLGRGRSQNQVRGQGQGQNHNQTQPPSNSQAIRTKLEPFRMFSLKEMQRLQEVMERVLEAHLVLELNLNVIRQMREYYKLLMESHPSEELKQIREACKTDCLHFAVKAKSVEANIERRLSQLKALQDLLQEGKTQYGRVLQQRDLQVNMLYVDSQHILSRDMRALAVQTRRETTSMHVITCVTLSFLPGTFIAGLFDAGVVSPGENGAGFGFNRGVLEAYVAIALPLTAVVYALWWCFSHYWQPTLGVEGGASKGTCDDSRDNDDSE